MKNSNHTARSCGATNQGCVRNHNEDAFGCFDDKQLWVVADGAGGHAAGDVASNLIVDRLAKLKRPRFCGDFISLIRSELDAVNEELIDLSGGSETRKIIGSTIALVVQESNHIVWLWSGDSRVYVSRNQQLEELTHDHNRVDEFIASGFGEEEVAKYPQAQYLTHAVGVESPLYLEMKSQQCLENDIYLLCSDGLYNAVNPGVIQTVLQSSGSLDNKAHQLIDCALANGARDNVTAVLVRILPSSGTLTA